MGKERKNLEKAFDEKVKTLDDLKNQGFLSEEEFDKQLKYAISAKDFLINNYSMVEKLFFNGDFTGYELDKRRFDLQFDFIKGFYPKIEEYFKNRL